MEHQPTIFNEDFHADVNIRRRAIMPLALKIYVWIGMIASGLFVVNFFFTISKLTAFDYDIPFVVGTLSPAVISFMMTFLLWSEVKWAIRFNWGVAALWLMMVMSVTIFAGLAGLSLALPITALLTPYWIMLFRIQKKWERKAVAGKQAKSLPQ